MSNRAHDHVHRLVRSMSRAEKRYFKLYTSRHMPGGHSNQQVLFDAIAAMEEYDEGALLARFKSDPFTHRFAITKRRLYETILRSLDAFHAEGSIDSRIHRMLHHVELLYQRAMYEDAEKVLQSVRRLAAQHEKHTALLQVLHWERKFIERANYAQAKPEQVDHCLRESDLLLQEQRQLDELWAVKSRVLISLYRHGKARDGAGLQELGDLLQHPVLTAAQNSHSSKIRFLYHHLNGAATFAMGDMAACHQHLHSAYKILKNGRECFKDEPYLAFSVLGNLVHVSVKIGEHAQAARLLKEFRLLPAQWNMPASEDLDLKLFCTTTSLELMMHCQVGNFHKAVEMLPMVERGLAQYGSRLGPVRTAGSYYQIAYAHFGNGDPGATLRWTHRLLNDIRIDESAEIVCFARLLNLLAHLESGRADMLPFALRSTMRYISTRGRGYRSESAIIELVRSLMKDPLDEQERSAIYQQFLEKVIPLESDPLEQVIFDHFDPIAWARSKISGRSFAELVKERAAGLPHAA